MFYTCNYNIRVTHRNGAISIFFTRIRSTEGSSADCSLFILSLHALALHLAVKILLQIFLYEDLSTLTPYICRLYFPPECQQDRTLLRSQYVKVKTFLIFDINHQQNTRRSDQISDKTIMQTTRPRITWKVLPMAQVAIFKEIFDQVRKDLDCGGFYSEPKNVTTSHIIFTI